METFCEVKDGIRNIELTSGSSDFTKYEFITSSHDDDLLVDENYGALIYVNKEDPMRSLKIYKDYGVFRMAVEMGCTKYVTPTHNNELDFIKKLQSIQDKVKLTRFPTGIVRYHDYIIGQEIPFYSGCTNLLVACQRVKTKEEIVSLYIKCLEIIKELCDNDIVYVDAHKNNFIVNKNNNCVNLIDFDSDYIFNPAFKEKYNDMLKNLKIMISTINDYLNISLVKYNKNATNVDDLLCDMKEERELMKRR